MSGFFYFIGAFFNKTLFNLNKLNFYTLVLKNSRIKRNCLSRLISDLRGHDEFEQCSYALHCVALRKNIKANFSFPTEKYFF